MLTTFFVGFVIGELLGLAGVTVAAGTYAALDLIFGDDDDE